ncbi:MAG: T9SS type A sorting domain-containing protein [Ignavibacteriaceae bacterium]
MKRLLLLSFLFVSVSLFAQSTIDFETVGQNFVWNIFANGTGDSTDLAVAANPDMSGINTSANVMKFVVNADATVFAGAFTDSIAPFTITTDNAHPSVMVYKDVMSRFDLKFEGFTGAHDAFDSNTVVNQWTKLTFDYSADIGKTVTRLTIIPDFPQDTRTAGSTNYFDNIEFIATPVPVELVSFGALTVGNNVQLNWKTATEKNNSGFEIQRSIDKKVYSTIGFVQGRGTTSETSTYSYTDKDVKGKVFYRLKQIDLDGTFNLSPVVEVNSLQPVQYQLAQNYPNPFNPTTTITYSIPQDNFVTIKVYNVLGNEVATLVNEQITSGSHKIDFNANKLSSGVYYYTIKAGNFVDTKKLILLK